MAKQATLADIIAKRKQGKMDKLQVKSYYSETLDMGIEIRKIPLGQYMDIVENLEEENSINGMNKLIYECCPLFREDAKEAMEVYEVAEPTDLPSAVLEDQLNEMKDIVEIINSFYGIDKIDSEIKN
ncbi:hypothetical protein [Tissierella creatinophila]|uniref:Phage XkdN-like protein n=1 Tax=Tissierella creatinophila DSM 6911 TaxID=1123403 RepID=A0A1U7M4R2_TISCR|nr:hypothetical protein [Tissierella creatinophila]OLS02240.1 hypothetical protein TICRE_17920 [Tissierella creatinophila DSM 6911]